MKSSLDALSMFLGNVETHNLTYKAQIEFLEHLMCHFQDFSLLQKLPKEVILMGCVDLGSFSRCFNKTLYIQGYNQPKRSSFIQQDPVTIMKTSSATGNT